MGVALVYLAASALLGAYWYHDDEPTRRHNPRKAGLIAVGVGLLWPLVLWFAFWFFVVIGPIERWVKAGERNAK